MRQIVQAQEKETKWQLEFELENNRFTVKFNDPRVSLPKLSQASDISQQIYTKMMIFDKRQSIQELKETIAKEVTNLSIKNSFQLGMNLDELIFKRGGAHGTELIEDEISLKAAQFHNMISVFVEKGIPSKLGMKRIKLVLAEPVTQADYVGQDNVYFKFRDLVEVPLKTLEKTADVK